MNYIIYRITNKINGKKYIGFSSKSLEERWNKHLRDAKAGRDTYLCRAIRKYGGDNFDREVIYTGDNIFYTKYVMENKFIIENEAHCTTGKGYNMTMGGEGTLGHAHSEKSRRQMSISQTGRKQSDATKRKLSEQRKGAGNPNFGKAPSLETREKISKQTKGSKNPRALSYVVKNPDGTQSVINDRIKWCKEHNLNYWSVCAATRRKNWHKGYFIEKITDTTTPH